MSLNLIERVCNSINDVLDNGNDFDETRAIIENGCGPTLERIVQVKTIEPNMKLDKQVQKGIAAVNHALDDNNVQKACYTIGVINLMVDMFLDGQPTPWSALSPLIDEEFDD